MAYELKIAAFQGPLEKLLELIEEKKMPIGELSLAAVTDDFLKYLEALKENQIPELNFSIIADFISVASRLILIKSKSLLPDLELTEEEESDIKNLEERLVLFKELKGAKKHIQNLWLQKKSMFGRPYFLSVPGAVSVFSPGEKMSIENLHASLQKIYEILQKFTRETETIKEKIISLEEKIREVIDRVTKVGETTLNNLAVAKSKSEIVAIFLAILHLAREQLVFLEQHGHFSDIVVRKAKSGIN